jgi:hypothetical protein
VLCCKAGTWLLYCQEKPWGCPQPEGFCRKVCFLASVVEPGRPQSSFGLNSNGYYTVGYADDAAINGKFLQTLSEVSQTPLCTVQQWCKRTKLSINPNKTVIIPFTEKRTIRNLRNQSSSAKWSSYEVKSSTLD